MCTNQYSLKRHEAKTDRIKQTNKQTDQYKIIVGDLNISLSATDRTTGHKVSKNREGLNNSINHRDDIDVDVTLSTTTVEYTFFQCSQNIQDRP